MKESRWGVPETVVTFCDGKETLTFDTWRYWEIVGALQWMGVDRLTAYDTAKKIQREKPGGMQEVWPGITMEITEKQKGETNGK